MPVMYPLRSEVNLTPSSTALGSESDSVPGVVALVQIVQGHGGAELDVVNVESEELLAVPSESADFTWKWYKVFDDSPVIVMLCAVTSAVLDKVDPYAAVVP